MSKTADARGSKLTRSESESESEAPALAGGFAPVSAQRSSSIQQAAKTPMLGGGETTQYQVPLDLLVLARNKERDKARSVAVTPVAPRPNSDEPPPSDELSELRIEPNIEPAVAAAISIPAPAPLPAQFPPASAASLPAAELTAAEPAGAERAVAERSAAASDDTPRAETDYVAMVAWLVLAALCLCAGYYGVELLLWQ